ncbi:hypothetical protein, partial [Nocardiopsis dassonvillei]|uniref:hypothetical protein n=1 Tax=Nocardiopsis dassonvillei TaxID=2014 RepID=UPI00366D695D
AAVSFSAEGVVRFRFVVSLLYQVFRAPPNRRFGVFLIGVKPVSCFASVFPWKRPPSLPAPKQCSER